MRADARLNRERIVDAARQILADGDELAHFDLATRAGVGVGTVYRNFPTRHELVEVVYASELEAVCGSAAELQAALPPVDALRAWLTRYAEFVATKRGMGDALRDLITAGSVTAPATRARLAAALEPLLAAGRADGVLRADVPADDVVAAMAGALMSATEETQTGRLLDLLVAGLRV